MIKIFPRASKLFIFAIVIFAFFFQECKKGPDDPAFSLRTRRARLEGKWNMKQGNAGITVLDPASSPFAQSFVLDGSYATVTETSAGPPTVYKFAFLISLDIKKDGTFTLNETYGSYTLIARGKWDFLNGVGAQKSKESVLFKIESVTNDQSTGHLFNIQRTEFVYKLIGLHNKEIKMEIGSKTYIDAAGKSVAYSGTYEFAQ